MVKRKSFSLLFCHTTYSSPFYNQHIPHSVRHPLEGNLLVWQLLLYWTVNGAYENEHFFILKTEWNS